MRTKQKRKLGRAYRRGVRHATADYIANVREGATIADDAVRRAGELEKALAAEYGHALELATKMATMGEVLGCGVGETPDDILARLKLLVDGGNLLRANVEWMRLHIQSMQAENDRLHDQLTNHSVVSAHTEQSLKDAALGRMVRAMPRGTELYHAWHGTEWRTQKKAHDHTQEFADTPEVALEKAGVTVPLVPNADDALRLHAERGRLAELGLRAESIVLASAITRTGLSGWQYSEPSGEWWSGDTLLGVLRDARVGECGDYAEQLRAGPDYCDTDDVAARLRAEDQAETVKSMGCDASALDIGGTVGMVTPAGETFTAEELAAAGVVRD